MARKNFGQPAKVIPTNIQSEATQERPEIPEETIAEAPQKVRVRAVHGLMIHPFKAMDIRHDAIAEVDEIDSWLQSQIDAKKIEVV